MYGMAMPGRDFRVQGVGSRVPRVHSGEQMLDIFNFIEMQCDRFPMKPIPGKPFQETQSHSGEHNVNPAGPSVTRAQVGPGSKWALGPSGPRAQVKWALGPSGPGPKWALGPSGARAQVGPGSKWVLGPSGGARAQVGPTWALDPLD